MEPLAPPPGWLPPYDSDGRLGTLDEILSSHIIGLSDETGTGVLVVIREPDLRPIHEIAAEMIAEQERFGARMRAAADEFNEMLRNPRFIEALNRGRAQMGLPPEPFDTDAAPDA